MKNNIILIAVLAVATMLSCTEILAPEQPSKDGQETSLMVLEAYMEQHNDTKTSLSGNSVVWTTGDKISVFSGTDNYEFTLTEIKGNGKGVFEGTAPAAATYYALYPYSSTASISESGVISTSVPCNQKGVAGTFDKDVNVSAAKFSGESFQMKNLCGLVKLNIVGSNIKSVALFGNGHEYLAGDVDITIESDGTPSYIVTNGTKYINLTPKTGETFTPGTYYFTILPQTMTGGMSLVYTTATQSGTVATTVDAVVNRSQYLTITANPELVLSLSNIIDLSDPTGSGTPETANCYVAGLAGRRYSLPATVMGNNYTFPEDNSYTTTLNGSSPELAPTPLSPVSAKLLWQTGASLLKHIVLQDGKIYFSLNGKVGGTLTQGNALIAGLGTDKLPEWSWHIWVTDVNLDSKVQTWTVHANAASYSAYQNPQLMDRNLGATTDLLWGDCGTNEAHGLFYQWGRKDPFPGADNSSRGSTIHQRTYDEQDVELPEKAGTSSFPTDFKWYNKSGALNDANVAKYPMRFCRVGSGTYWNPTKFNLWGRPMYPMEDNKIGNKTIYDPCPPGYRVMNPYAMTGLTQKWGGGKFVDLKDGMGNFLHSVINMDMTNDGNSLIRDDGGMKVKYDGANIAYLPNTGTITNDTDIFQRTLDYGYYWTSTPAYTAGAGRGIIVNFDYNTLNTIHETSIYSRACRGNVVRCEKI